MIKGKSKIELTNVKTGEVKTYENENMLTNLIDILPKAMNFNSALSLFSYPIWKSLFGSIFLFHENLEENKNKIFPDGSNLPFASAGNSVNSGSISNLGSFNENESGIQSDGSAKLVWDFNTSQANGKINALSLSSGKAGLCCYGTDDPVSYVWGNSSLAYSIKQFSNAITQNDRPMLVDYDNQIMYYWAYTSGKKTTLDIRTRNICLNNIKLTTDAFISATYKSNTIQLNTTLQGLNAYYLNTLKNGKSYFAFSPSTAVEIGVTFYILEIDLFNNFTSKVYTMTNNTNEKLIINIESASCEQHSVVCENGYLYIQTYTASKMYKIKLSDSTDTSIVLSGLTNKQMIRWINEDYLYFNYYNENIKILNLKDDTYKYLNNATNYAFSFYNQQSFYSWCVPIIMKDYTSPFFLYLYGGSNTTTVGISFFNNFLITINNLSSEVIKTADNSMKITYTLTQTGEEES